MERFFRDKPEISNRNVWLADKAKVSQETVRRTLKRLSGISIDNLEAIASVLGVAPYKFLMPSDGVARLLAVDPADAELAEVQEQLQRRRRR